MAVSPALDELLPTSQRTALHLELRDTYAAGSPTFAAWKAGESFDRTSPDAQWHARIKPVIDRGVDVRRARVVSEPVSDFIRYEHQVTPAANIAVGEKVRWVPRQRVSRLAIPGNDLWLIDDQVLFLHFSGEGKRVNTELMNQPEVVRFCLSAFEKIWELGVDHADYQPT